MKFKPAKRQIRLAIASNAGGSGKTTLAVHLAYGIGRLGYKVVIMELDHNGSLCVYGNVPPARAEKSMAAVFKKSFKGGYPLVPLWQDHIKTVSAILGGESLEESFNDVYISSRKYYTLQDRLSDHPLDADLVVFDLPATLEPMGQVALAAATHVIASIKPVAKDIWSFANLLRWVYVKIEDLRLRPAPKFIGCIPSLVDLGKATHRDSLGVDRSGKQNLQIDLNNTLPYHLQQENILQFPNVRHCEYYLHAAQDGVPLYVKRPGCEWVKDFDPIIEVVVQAMTQE